MDQAIRDYHRRLLAGDGSIQEYFRLLERGGQAGAFLAANINHYHYEAMRHHLTNKGSFDLTSSFGQDKQSAAVDAVDWLLQQKLTGRALIICPSLMRTSWQQKVTQKGLSPCVVLGKRDAGRLTDPKFSVFIMSYEMVTSLCKYALWPEAYTWPVIVCDEASYLKNPNTQRHRAIGWVADHHGTKWRIALGSLPASAHLEDVYALFKFIDPKMFPMKSWAFREKYMMPDPNNRFGWVERPGARKEMLRLVTAWKGAFNFIDPTADFIDSTAD